MADFKKRQKASEVYSKSKPLLGPRVPFKDAFPMIEKIDVKVEEEGDGINEWNKITHFRNSTLGKYIDCHNPMCWNGGFDIGQRIRFMIEHKQAELEDSAICQGHEGSPKGRRKYGSCSNRFKMSIKISYKESE